MAIEDLINPYRTMRTDALLFAPFHELVINFFPKATRVPSDDMMECFINLLMEPIQEGRPFYGFNRDTKNEILYCPIEGFLRDLDAAASDVLNYKTQSSPLDTEDVMVFTSVKRGLYENEMFLTSIAPFLRTEEEIRQICSENIIDGKGKAERFICPSDIDLEKLSVNLQECVLEVLKQAAKRLTRNQRPKDPPTGNAPWEPMG